MKHAYIKKTRIVIAGGGFAGLYAAKYLDKRLARRSDVEVTLISRENFPRANILPNRHSHRPCIFVISTVRAESFYSSLLIVRDYSQSQSCSRNRQLPSSLLIVQERSFPRSPRRFARSRRHGLW